MHTYDKATDHHLLSRILPIHGIPILAQNQALAFLQPIYPYGNGLVCVRRCWTHVCLTGAYKNRRRLMSQTSHVVWNRTYTQEINRKGEEAVREFMMHNLLDAMGITWNTPHATTYAPYTCWVHPRSPYGAVIPEMRETLCPFVLHLASKPDHYLRLRQYFSMFASLYLERGIPPAETQRFRDNLLVLEGMEKLGRSDDKELWQGVAPIFLGV